MSASGSMKFPIAQESISPGETKTWSGCLICTFRVTRQTDIDRVFRVRGRTSAPDELGEIIQVDSQISQADKWCFIVLASQLLGHFLVKPPDRTRLESAGPFLKLSAKHIQPFFFSPLL